MRCLLFAVALFAGSALVVDSAAGAFPGANGKIVFVSDSDPGGVLNEDVFVMNRDGSGRRQLTHHATADRMPVFSPDGRRIAFTRDHGDNLQIYVMRSDGTHERRLSHNRADDFQPAWSPDGKRIVFLRDRPPDEPGSIYVMDRDGSHVRELTDDHADGNPAFSPDGRRIAFVRAKGGPPNFEGVHRIYLMNADGSHQRLLAKKPASSFAPDFSPDGRTIAFHTLNSRTNRVNIYAMRSDGTHVRRLTDPTWEASDPRFSPNGKKIAFDRYGGDRGVSYAIYVMGADGSHPHPLTGGDDGSGWNLGPNWQPIPRHDEGDGFR